MSKFAEILRILLRPSPVLPQVPPNSAADSTAEQTLQHAKDGYKNSQEVIRFVDTKTAVITGLSTLIAGSLVAILKWSIESDAEANLQLLARGHPCIAFCFY